MLPLLPLYESFRAVAVYAPCGGGALEKYTCRSEKSDVKTRTVSG